MSTLTESRFLAVAALVLLLSSANAVGQATHYGFGTTPSADELAQFTSPLPDGRGLPPGSGSAEQGKLVYETQCVACHGANLEGGLGDRLVGGRGTLVNDNPAKAPMKTIESYWPYSTTIFDYVKRAMPMTAPASLSNDQVYAVTAYLLSQAKVISPDTVMNASTLAAVQMPNRDGFIPDPRPESFPPVAKTSHQFLEIVAAPTK
jgi:mono/diheme cytochrome c family protein